MSLIPELIGLAKAPFLPEAGTAQLEPCGLGVGEGGFPEENQRLSPKGRLVPGQTETGESQAACLTAPKGGMMVPFIEEETQTQRSQVS